MKRNVSAYTLNCVPTRIVYSIRGIPKYNNSHIYEIHCKILKRVTPQSRTNSYSPLIQ